MAAFLMQITGMLNVKRGFTLGVVCDEAIYNKVCHVFGLLHSLSSFKLLKNLRKTMNETKNMTNFMANYFIR